MTTPTTDRPCHPLAPATRLLAQAAADRISSVVLRYEPRRCARCGRWPLRMVQASRRPA